jgi:hypothetical protein
VTFAVDYPDRSLNRLTTAFRIFTIPSIAILAAFLEGGSFATNSGGSGASYRDDDDAPAERENRSAFRSRKPQSPIHSTQLPPACGGPPPLDGLLRLPFAATSAWSRMMMKVAEKPRRSG